MKNIIRFKSLVSIILSIVITFASVPLRATTLTQALQPDPTISIPITPTEHKQTIKQFIAEISQIQSQVFDIAQFALNNPPVFKEKLKSNVNSINNSIEKLNQRILEYLETIPSIGPQNVHLLLVLNSLNFVKNGLYWLEALTHTRENVLRVVLLNEYFRSRLAAEDTVRTVSDLVSQYNS